MSKKNINPKFTNRRSQHTETKDERMCRVYAAYKRVHKGDVKFTREEFLAYTSDAITSIIKTFDLYDELNKVTYIKELQSAISEGYDQCIKELQNHSLNELGLKIKRYRMCNKK